MTQLDVVIVGSGPNGLAAAVELARAGLGVTVLEARDEIGGGARSAELTLPGYVHDVCSAVHPLAKASPFFRQLGLEQYGLQWVEPQAPLAHVLDDRVILLERSLEETAQQFGSEGAAYMELLGPLVHEFEALLPMVLGPLRWPKHPWLMASFGLKALRSMQGLAGRFQDEGLRGLLAGLAGHSMLPLDAPATAAIALILGAAGHSVGWPLARGGSGAVTRALGAALAAQGGTVELGRRVERWADLPAARAYLFDVTPRQLLQIAPEMLSTSYKRSLERYRYGPGVFKIDWALSEPVPWRDARCRRAGTVHIGGTLKQVHESLLSVHRGQVASEPFVLFVQPTSADPSRAPAGKHVGWAYCHLPPRFEGDLSSLIEARIERFAPGFRDTILARSFRDAVAFEQYNANYVDGDINGGTADLAQLFFRPALRMDPYATSAPHLFLCSASTPPGGGVHGHCGYWAARSALDYLERGG